MSLEGQQIGRYRIVRLLGSGGMGDVYLAEDARIEQQVAIKVIRAEVNAQASQEAMRLFQREAKAIARLDHPSILPLYDYGEEQLGDMAIIYLVMPYRKEGSLTSWLCQHSQAGVLAPQEALHFIGQAASALQHAHDRQIIHQDVKPSNFLLRSRQETPTRPDLLLADFGIARLATATASASQSIRGTPTYMAPEQWEGHPIPATDQYALAIMAYELLTGRPPFQGAPGPLMYQHLMAAVPPASSVNPRLSRDLDAVLVSALAKRPEQRFASMTAFATAFQQAVQALPAAGPPPPAPAHSGDLRAVLAISPVEAQKGTTRTLTLPGGRQVRVSVPVGVRDGQIVRLDGLGEPSPTGGSGGALLLSILVKTAEEASRLPAAGAEATFLAANPAAPVTHAPTVGTTGQQPSVSHPARPEMTTPPSAVAGSPPASTTARQMSLPPMEQAPSTRPAVGWPADRSWPSPAPIIAHPRRGISRRTVIIGLAGLAVVGVAGGGLLWLARSQQPAAPSAPTSHSPSPTSMPTPSSTPPPVGTTLYTYRGHSDWVYAVAWSPDGRRVASGGSSYSGNDNTVQVWDATNGGNVYAYRGHSSVVSAVAWSPDGKRIASGSNDKTVQVWDAADGGNVYTYNGHSGAVLAVAWSPDDRRIASGSGQYQGTDNTVQVWDATDGGNVYTYRGHSNYVNAVAWSPDGRRIASAGGDHTVRVWVAR